MAKRKIRCIEDCQDTPPSPFRSKPYSLGDIEFRAELENRGGIKDDPVAELALRRIEQLTGGDYGQVLKYILPRKEGVPKSKSEKRLDEVVKQYANVKSAADTNIRGLYLPTESAERIYTGTRSKDPNLPEIFIQQPTVYKKNTLSEDAMKKATKQGQDFKLGYFRKITGKIRNKRRR